MRIFLTITICITGYILYGQETILPKKSPADTLSVKYLEEVIVSASRVREKILQSPVSVEKVSEGYFKSNAAFSFFDALGKYQRSSNDHSKSRFPDFKHPWFFEYDQCSLCSDGGWDGYSVAAYWKSHWKFIWAR